MKKLILHIGTEKTGTTSLQRWASSNRSILLKNGIAYSSVLGDSNHHKIFLSVLREKVWKQNASSFDISGYPAERQSFSEAVRSNFANEVVGMEKHGAHNFFISSEHCHSRLITKDEVTSLHCLLAPFFDEIVIVCFLRPQIEMAVSLASTAARGGGIVDRVFFERVSEDTEYFNYEALTQRWGEVFGYENIKMVPFKRYPDTVKFFLEFFDLNSEDFEKPRRSNEALDIRTIALSNMLVRGSKKVRKGQGRVPALPFNDMPVHDKLRLSRDFAMEIQERLVESNERLLKRFECMRDFAPEDLVPDWSKYDETTNLDLLDDNAGFGDFVFAMLQPYEHRERLLRASVSVAVAERALANGNGNGVRAAVQKAQEHLKPLRTGHGMAETIERLDGRLKVVIKGIDVD